MEPKRYTQADVERLVLGEGWEELTEGLEPWRVEAAWKELVELANVPWTIAHYPKLDLKARDLYRLGETLERLLPKIEWACQHWHVRIEVLRLIHQVQDQNIDGASGLEPETGFELLAEIPPRVQVLARLIRHARKTQRSKGSLLEHDVAFCAGMFVAIVGTDRVREAVPVLQLIYAANGLCSRIKDATGKVFVDAQPTEESLRKLLKSPSPSNPFYLLRTRK